MKEEDFLKEIEQLAERINEVKDKEYFKKRTQNLIETYMASLESRKLLNIKV